MKTTLDSPTDKHYGCNYIFVSQDIAKRYSEHQVQNANLINHAELEGLLRVEIEMFHEFCTDNIKVYRQLKDITSEYKIHYLDEKLIDMRTSIKIMNNIKKQW